MKVQIEIFRDRTAEGHPITAYIQGNMRHAVIPMDTDPYGYIDLDELLARLREFERSVRP